MDTKWKKSKALAGFFSFALGISLLLASLLPLAGDLLHESGRQRLQNALKIDFQETSSFRSYLSGMMNSFIAMGVGGPVSGGYYDSYDYGEAVLVEGEAIIQTAVIQDDGWYQSDSLQPTAADKTRWKKEAEAWNKMLQEDQNLLYSITYDGKVLYSNTEDISLYPTKGYTFLLSFDGSTCTASKRGKPVDLYGNGIFVEDGSHWEVPGYSNFQAGEEAKKVTVSMVVADEPALYIKGNYSSQWGQRQYNTYYYRYQNWRESRQRLKLGGFMALAGVVLLVGWFFLRREKSLADRAIAGITGHIWFEVKLLLLLGAVILLFLPFTSEMRYLLTEVTYAVSIEDGGYYPVPWFLERYLYEILCRPGATLTAFWACYLFVNDLRYGDKPWRHGVWGMLTAKSLKFPIQKRLSRRSVVLTIVFLVLGGYIALFIPVLNFGFSNGLKFFLPPALALFVGLALAIGPRQQRLWRDVGCLVDQITAVHDGNFTASPLPADSDLGKASREVADIQQGMAQAVEEQTRSERMKVELVTNVSHDIKTPLTSIISYTELLRQEGLAPPAGEYVEILSQKAERLRAMVVDVFEISKAASGELPVKLGPLELDKLLRQTLADMEQVIEDAPVTLRQSFPQEPVTITADGDRLYRVFQNLLQNALKYALEGSRVYLTLSVRDNRAEVSVKNTSKTELPVGVDFTERFVRGDQSRSDGGSGLGLAIADSFTRACGGELKVEPVADLFVVTVTFPLSEASPQNEE